MSEDERRERIYVVADLIDDVLSEGESFCLVVFRSRPPDDQEKARFDVVSNNRDREYVMNVLQHVIEGIDASEGEVLVDTGRPN